MENNMMNVTRKSVLTGKIRTRNILVKPEDLAKYEAGSASVNDSMPYLNAADREFITCGITGHEWKNAFSKQLQEIIRDKF
jgi:hypothetical protein